MFPLLRITSKSTPLHPITDVVEGLSLEHISHKYRHREAQIRSPPQLSFEAVKCVLGVRTVPYMVYGRTTMVSVGHGTIHIPYHEDHLQRLSASVQVWHGRRWPFTTVYYSVKFIYFTYENKSQLPI